MTLTAKNNHKKISKFYESVKEYDIRYFSRTGPMLGPADIKKNSCLDWGEHCVECASPHCYKTCDTFVSNENGKCRRFLYGIQTSQEFSYLKDHSLKIIFLPWGNLLAYVKEPLIDYNGFLMQAYNPNDKDIQVLFYYKNKQKEIKFMISEQIKPGFNQSFFAFKDTQEYIKVEDIGSVFISPNVDENTLLYVSYADFIKSAKEEMDFSGIKCLAFDLDNTLWKGILLEDGPDKVSLNEELLRYIREFKKKGMIISAVSKNNWQDVREVLEQRGITDLFVFPQINWEDKSFSLKQLAEILGIGLNSIVFIDDSEYEREEVRLNAPAVRAWSPEEIPLFYQGREFQNITQTDEGSDRMAFYKQEEERKNLEKEPSLKKEDFIRKCQICVQVRGPQENDLNRVQELIQRTNQLNFSNHRYTRNEVEQLLKDDLKYICRVVSAKDRFGSYGIIGFFIIEKINPKEWLIRDLMFSCRIQGRHIDLFVIQKILEEAFKNKISTVKGILSYNTRNESAKKAYLLTNFRQTEEKENTAYFEFDLLNQKFPQVDYITMEE